MERNFAILYIKISTCVPGTLDISYLLQLLTEQMLQIYTVGYILSSMLPLFIKKSFLVLRDLKEDLNKSDGRETNKGHRKHSVKNKCNNIK